MKIYKLDDGSVNCYVLAQSKEDALKLDTVRDYFEDALYANDIEIEVVEMALKDDLEINFDTGKIKHTVEEWQEIWNIVYKPVIICSSEY